MSNPGHNQERIPTRQVDLYEATPKIQVRSVRGRFADLRSRLRWGFLLVLMAGPWLTWNDRQALLFDLPERQFHVFGLTFFPQDFILVSGLLIIGAFALFAVTNWLGRVWCGYTCPHSVWFQMFIDIEQWIEGPRHRRIRQDEGPWTGAIWRMKIRKWLVWAGLAVVTGVSIVGYFVPIRELILALATLSLGGLGLFWVGFFVTATFGMGAILREQVCLYMCPYARFQSAMFDPDTLIVSYDPGRGEPRGPRPRKADPQELGLGDCIDCELCVQVCPVGIDIRDGLQYECISCAHCIDACDGVMERMGYAPGLISYTTENRLEGRHSPVLRPRLIGYGLVLAIMIAAFGWLALARGEAELDVLRDRAALIAR
ncbi:MAG: cytochrome c oxidase accessory protein CcoG [Gammaproteobacteria bacterium]|nr:cytochrome c oxidase accessory protein CcoG [Gammaproteobacteria bacterium]